MNEVFTTSTAKVVKLKEEGYVITGIAYFMYSENRLFTLRKGSERS